MFYRIQVISGCNVVEILFIKPSKVLTIDNFMIDIIRKGKNYAKYKAGIYR